MSEKKENDTHGRNAKAVVGWTGLGIIVWCIVIGKAFFPVEMNFMQEKFVTMCSEWADGAEIYLGLKDTNPYQINEFLPEQSILKRYIYPGKSAKQYVQRHEYVMVNGSGRALYRTISIGKNQYGMIELLFGKSSPWELGEYIYDDEMQIVKKVMYKSSAENVRGDDRTIDYVFLDYSTKEKTSTDSVVELAESDIAVEMPNLGKTFEHCIKMRTQTGLKGNDGKEILLYSYYAPHLGLIKQEMEAEGKIKTYMELDKYVFYNLQASDMRYGIMLPDLPVK